MTWTGPHPVCFNGRMTRILFRQTIVATAFAVLLAGCATPPASEAPLIGVTSSYKKGESGWPDSMRVSMTYIDAVRQSGGIPVVLPPVTDEEVMARYLRELDGLLLVGGYDVPPEAYGEKAEPEVKPMAMERWNFESTLVGNWLDTGKPILGICLGSQVVNVVQGGTLIQDIPRFVGTEVAHRGDRKDAEHVVDLEPDSRLAAILGEETVTVRAFHHQAVKDLGRDLKVVGRTRDGVIEALELKGHKFGIFVQWHPERMEGTDHRRRLFDAFLESIEGRRSHE